MNSVWKAHREDGEAFGTRVLENKCNRELNTGDCFSQKHLLKLNSGLFQYCNCNVPRCSLFYHVHCFVCFHLKTEKCVAKPVNVCKTANSPDFYQ